MTTSSKIAKPLISIIVPVYNEEQNVQRAYLAIIEELKKLESIDYEILFTDNHSKDRTFDILKQIAASDPKVRVLRFVRNLGFQHSILTGYRHARGDAAIQIDCDLQDPPSLFADFIRLWREGHDVVVGLRSKRPEHKSMLLLRKFYYWLLERISDVSEIPHQADAGDFRLVDRSILNQLRVIQDTHPYVRGFISELAKNQTGVLFERKKRELGESKFPIKRLIKMGLDGIFVYSTLPLRIATYLGIYIALGTFGLITIYLFAWLFFSKSWTPGFTTHTLLLLFGISLNAIFLGIIGEYLGRIYNQIRGRPIVVVERTLNMSSELHPFFPTHPSAQDIHSGSFRDGF